MRWLFVLACAGCGRLAFEERTLEPDAMPDSTPLRQCTTIAFEELPPELTKVGGGTVEIVNGQVVFSIPGDLNSEAYLDLITPTSFVGRTTVMQVVSPSMTVGASTAMGWHDTTGDDVGVHMEMDGVNLKFNRYNATIDEYTEFRAMPYDPVAFAWWQLREEGGLIISEVSSDGVEWNLFSSVAGFDLSAMTWDFGLGAYVAAIPPSESTADNSVNCVP